MTQVIRLLYLTILLLISKYKCQDNTDYLEQHFRFFNMDPMNISDQEQAKQFSLFVNNETLYEVDRMCCPSKQLYKYFLLLAGQNITYEDNLTERHLEIIVTETKCAKSTVDKKTFLRFLKLQ